MTDKLTDSEIVKALECCFMEQQCNNCPLYKEHSVDCLDKEHSVDCLDTVLENAHALITRQQAEYENLKVENQSLRSAANSLKMHYEEAQAEVERLTKSLELVKGAREMSDTIQDGIYPLTITSDRYSGVYSGGKYIAWNLDADEVPGDIYSDDCGCDEFWTTNTIVCGKGNTVEEAIGDLYIKLRKGAKR